MANICRNEGKREGKNEEKGVVSIIINSILIREAYSTGRAAVNWLTLHDFPRVEAIHAAHYVCRDLDHFDSPSPWSILI
jgi:hypothetical protein